MPAAEASLSVLLSHKLPRQLDGLMSVGDVSRLGRLGMLHDWCGGRVMGLGLWSQCTPLTSQALLPPPHHAHLCPGPLTPLSQFPVNYFTVSEVEQWFGADFLAAFEWAAGELLA